MDRLDVGEYAFLFSFRDLLGSFFGILVTFICKYFIVGDEYLAICVDMIILKSKLFQ